MEAGSRSVRGGLWMLWGPCGVWDRGTCLCLQMWFVQSAQLHCAGMEQLPFCAELTARPFDIFKQIDTEPSDGTISYKAPWHH